MPEAAIAAGILGQAAVWRSIAARRLGFWPATTITFAILGVAAVLLRSPGCCPYRASGVVVGIGSGIALYVATRVVVGQLVRLASFAASVVEVYRRPEEVPTPVVWVLTLAIAVPGEELFWRGLVLPELQEATSLLAGASLAWVAYVAVNAFSRNLSIVAAAIVGGAWWTALGSFEHVTAPVVSHLVWTGLMLAWPPAADRAKVTP